MMMRRVEMFMRPGRATGLPPADRMGEDGNGLRVRAIRELTIWLPRTEQEDACQRVHGRVWTDTPLPAIACIVEADL
jgi:hypothetical protein